MLLIESVQMVGAEGKVAVGVWWTSGAALECVPVPECKLPLCDPVARLSRTTG